MEIIGVTGQNARAIASNVAKHMNAKDSIEIIPADKTAKYKEKLYRLAEVQNSV